MIVPEPDRATIAAAAARRGLDVEEVREDSRGTTWRVTVVVDGDDGAPLDLLTELSHELDPLAERWGGPSRAVTLEVTSRGVDAALTEPRHWRRARGRSVELRWAPGATGPERARVGDVDERAGTVRLVHSVKGRRPKAGTVALDSVAHAVVRVEFSPAPEAELELLSEPGGASRNGTTEGTER